ncbi:MAG: hypothetical protein IJO74_06725 [Clostridia bacterium]|nr:hypothetical protein [Clostridia bacterium]
MYNIDTQKILFMNDIQKRTYIKQCEKEYDDKLAEIAYKISQKKSIRLCGLAGPSCAGKTTTSFKLTMQLEDYNLWVRTLSIDDFFYDRKLGPIGEDGKPDYESPNFVNIDLLHSTLEAVMKGRKVYLPKYDFVSGKRTDKYEQYTPSSKDIIVLEGLHALNDTMYYGISDDEFYRIFIDAEENVLLDGKKLFSGIDLRLFRRIIRDMKFRGSTPENTMNLWEKVLEGEIKYIHPFAGHADFKINSVFEYEACALKKQTVNALNKINSDSVHYEYAKVMCDKLNLVPEINENLVPGNSLLQEFLGGDYFKYD